MMSEKKLGYFTFPFTHVIIICKNEWSVEDEEEFRELVEKM